MARVSLIIPTRNESENIKTLLLKLLPYDYDVVVVDDSNDATPSIAEDLGARIIYGQHRGLGQAIIDGIKGSDGDIVVVMDADGSHPVNVLPEMINKVTDGYDMAIGSRYVPGGKINGWTAKRKLISRVASGLAYPISGIRDSSSGYFAFKRSILDGADLQPTSWKIMLEILVKAKPKRVIEVPITFIDRVDGKSKLTSKEVYRYLKHLVLLSFHRYRILNFIAIGGIGYFINMAIYYPLTLLFQNDVTFLGQHFYLPPFVISSFVAITSNYSMNKHWTFNDRKTSTLSYPKYLSMGLVTLLLDMVLLFLFVDFGRLVPIVAAGLAIAIAFIIRYICADRWIWKRKV